MVKILCMDVDGTLTDGRIYMGSEGEQFKAFDVKDGYGICHVLPEMGIIPVIITGRRSGSLAKRGVELGVIDVYQGVSDKESCLEGVLRSKGLSLFDVAYIGDDLNDLACMDLVVAGGGVVGCPCDADPLVCAKAHFVSSRPGGRGAVREFIDWIAMSQS